MVRRYALVARARARSAKGALVARARARSARGAYLAALAAAAVAALCAPAFCYLRVHPSNPHYFQETTTGKAILVATVSGLVPENLGYDDIASISQTILRRRLPYARVWHLFGYKDANSVEPWAFSAQTGACYTVPYKFDLNTWNPTYWTEAEYVARGYLLAGYQTYGTRMIDLTGDTACDNNPNFALRFRWQFNTATDTGWLDNTGLEADV